MNQITGRNFQVAEKEKIVQLTKDYGVEIDERNMDHYSNIGIEGWWGEKTLLPGLHQVNPIRGKFVIDLFKQYQISNSHQIIEIGCGGGIFCEYIARQGYNILGVDISSGSISVAQEHALKNNLTVNYQTASVYELPFADESFDVVMSSDFLEHIEDLERAIYEMSRILKQNGLFIFDTISRSEKSVQTYMSLESQGLIPPGVHDPFLFVQPEELETLATKYGIEFARDDNNPYGFLIEAIEIIDGSFQLESIKAKDNFGTYIGYGIKK
ncbi:MAG: bifunctional 2-polyprenyl-6-hydroxyphenol methylase/3-demethylubiquinol 3-O-methyltransferase UbiG [Microcoleaceae cyanobacterium MO_207.B10]|nr:bifunctional 2-polyprenyl-6-hydroxyphenol methylase/3-demethylubiquinol 3-O-methyltransferase UbiG [Microcoleaceae cyanobacterium MO_207.B10]